MKLVKIFSLVIFCALCFNFSSCGDSVDCEDTAAASEELLRIFESTNSAVETYNADQSADNCNALVSALEDFVDTLKKYDECATTQEEMDDFAQQIRDAEAQISDLNC